MEVAEASAPVSATEAPAPVSAAEAPAPVSAAEARRLRILAKAEQRLAAVTGRRKLEDEAAEEAQRPTTEEAGPPPAEPAQTSQAAEGGADQGEPGPSTGVQGASEPATSSRQVASSGTHRLGAWDRYAKGDVGGAGPAPAGAVGPHPPTTWVDRLTAASRLTSLLRLVLAVWWAAARVCDVGPNPGPWLALCVAALAMQAAAAQLLVGFPRLTARMVRRVTASMEGEAGEGGVWPAVCACCRAPRADRGGPAAVEGFGPGSVEALLHDTGQGPWAQAPRRPLLDVL